MNVNPLRLLLSAGLCLSLAAFLGGCHNDSKASSGSAASAPQPASPASTPPGDAGMADWRSAEAPLLSGYVQITSRQKFMKAGEQYFNADASWIIFQGIPVPENASEPPAPNYAMYVAKLIRDGQGHVTGMQEPFMISPAGAANTCGWFHPTDPARVIYGSTIGAPEAHDKAGFQVGTNRYRWAFPAEMEIVSQTVRPIVLSLGQAQQSQCGTDYVPAPVFHRDGYDAECSFDSSGRFILYANVDPAKTTPDGRADADIYVYDTKTRQHRAIVVAKGYDGGPFFSPDGKSICYRSDRQQNDLLQLYVADLKFETGPDGVAAPVGITHEYQVTANGSVNWAPFWHPSGKFLVYGTSEVGHSNYEVFAVEFERSKVAEGKTAELRRRRITYAAGADVLPTFSPDGSMMMWTSQRGPKVEGEERPSSQIWIAQWNGMPFSKDWKE